MTFMIALPLKGKAMEIGVEPFSADITILHIHGRLDLLTSAELKQRVSELTDSRRHRIIIDLHNCSYIDSSGLGVIIGCLKIARRGGGDVQIARPAEQARVILELTTLNRVLRPHASLEDALASFASP
jgi:anti-sigma B factor antagonist